MKRIVVLGAGFSGLWAGIAAKRRLLESNADSDVAVTVVSRDDFHNIRVRNYEKDLSDVCVPLSQVLVPVGVQSLKAEIEDINAQAHQVGVRNADGKRVTIHYDRLVVALGSQLTKPDLPGLSDFAHDVDTYEAAERLSEHLKRLPARDEAGRSTVVVVGAGLTGMEVATEMTERLEELFPGKGNVVLIDRHPYLGSDLGPHARPVLEEASRSLNIECRLQTSIASVIESAVTLTTGETIPACTVIWCGGMQVNPLVFKVPGARDAAGRLLVDEYMRVHGVADVFAAGDAASARIDSDHQTVMSCQHGRPMGRYAGNNAAADLLGQPMLPLSVDWYVTVVDLGRWGALYTKGFDRQLYATGQEAKKTKQKINRERIYPPLSGKAEEILAAAAPAVQQPPAVERPTIDQPGGRA